MDMRAPTRTFARLARRPGDQSPAGACALESAACGRLNGTIARDHRPPGLLRPGVEAKAMATAQRPLCRRKRMNDVSNLGQTSTIPVVIPVEAYVSREYAQAEKDRLWAKVWQVACRVEE